jgi:hypothetical protein
MANVDTNTLFLGRDIFDQQPQNKKFSEIDIINNSEDTCS